MMRSFATWRPGRSPARGKNPSFIASRSPSRPFPSASSAINNGAIPRAVRSSEFGVRSIWLSLRIPNAAPRTLDVGVNLTLRVWRQQHAKDSGHFEIYEAKALSPDLSFLEMLDAVNDELQRRGVAPIAFDHDCRECICGACSMMINGFAHGPEPAVATCQLYLRHFTDGETITIEPWRAKAFPVVKDLVVDRSAFDRIIRSGGYVSVDTGHASEANSLPVPTET